MLFYRDRATSNRDNVRSFMSIFSSEGFKPVKHHQAVFRGHFRPPVKGTRYGVCLLTIRLYMKSSFFRKEKINLSFSFQIIKMSANIHLPKADKLYTSLRWALDCNIQFLIDIFLGIGVVVV